MPEWWTYRLSDFLLFSPRTYYRLIERYNEAIWPAQVLMLAVGSWMLVALRRSRHWYGTACSGLLALQWTWVGLMFLWRRYASINWAAAYFVPLFGLEALLLVWLGVVRRRLTPTSVTSATKSRWGSGLLLLSVIIYPVLAPLGGRRWEAAEVMGLAPDPTAIATLGFVLLTARPRWALLLVPLAWILFSGATLWAMASPEASVVLLAGLVAIVAAARSRAVSGSAAAAWL
jgi:hypothetical protein